MFYHFCVTWVRGPLARQYSGRPEPCGERISAPSFLVPPTSTPRKRGAGGSEQNGSSFVYAVENVG